MSTPDNGVATVTAPFLLQREDMRLCRDLMGGTRAMLAAGEKYIPRNDGESAASWKQRLERTVLFNVYMRTLRYLCGRVFEKQVSLEDGADERFAAFCEDVDHMGSNITVWGRHAFESGLNDGVTFCVVDFNDVRGREIDGRRQYLDETGNWQDRTEAAARLNGWGPYFIRVDADQVLDCRIEWHRGRPRVSHFRYVENCQRPSGRWNIEEYQRIRAYYLDENGDARWEVYSNGAASQAEWALEDAGTFSIGVLPVCIFMPGEKRTAVTAEPALMDLAWLNKRHWQETSAHANLMEHVWLPVWFGKCLGEFDEETGKTKITFGPGVLCHSTNEGASLVSAGVDPGSVAAGRQELKDLEDRMAVYGLQLLQPKTGTITATESMRDSEENNSTLKAWALQFQDFLENCFRMAALWWKLPDGPGVVVNTDFSSLTDVDMLIQLHNLQVISSESLLNILKGKGLLPDDFVVEDELARIARNLVASGANDFENALKADL